MKNIVFVSEKLQHKLHTLSASLNMDGELVFNDGEVYSNDGREVDEYLMVRAQHKNHVMGLLDKAFNGLSITCGETADDRLFRMLDRLAGSGHWKALDEVENWLMDRNVPFIKRRVVY